MKGGDADGRMPTCSARLKPRHGNPEGSHYIGKPETVLTPGHKAATQNSDVLVVLWGSLDGQA